MDESEEAEGKNCMGIANAMAEKKFLFFLSSILVQISTSK